MTKRPLTLTLALAMIVASALPSVALAKDKLRIRAALVNTGAEPAADGKAELRITKKDRARFKVEAEDLTPANYEVVVGGVVLDVRMQPADVEGEIEFDTKRNRGHVPLTFDPRGELVTVERARTVFLQVVFPNL